MMLHVTNQSLIHWLRVEPAYPGAKVEIIVPLLVAFQWLWRRLNVPNHWVCVVVYDYVKPPHKLLGITYEDPDLPRPYQYFPYLKNAPDK